MQPGHHDLKKKEKRQRWHVILLTAKWITTFPKAKRRKGLLLMLLSRFISRYIISPSRVVLFIIVGTPPFPSYVVQDANRLIDLTLSDDRPTVTDDPSKWFYFLILSSLSFVSKGTGTFSSRFMFTRHFWPNFVGDGPPPFFNNRFTNFTILSKQLLLNLLDLVRLRHFRCHNRHNHHTSSE